MSLKEQLTNDIKQAMRSGDNDTRDTLRMLVAALRQVEVDEKISLEDTRVMDILQKQAKQRRESIADYEKAGRTDMAEAEKVELSVIEQYLPKQMSRDEIAAVVTELIASTGASSPKDMGRIMGPVMGKLKGKADGKLISQVVKELLS